MSILKPEITRRHPKNA